MSHLIVDEDTIGTYELLLDTKKTDSQYVQDERDIEDALLRANEQFETS